LRPPSNSQDTLLHVHPIPSPINVSNATQYAVDENTYSPNTDTALTNGLQAVLLGKKTVDDMLADVQAANKKDHACAPTCQ
jgi:hypothetical protein